ncbi:UPF0193 protein EVG1 homolog [Anoplophora glabripennis]|uniref:UPF0193 protein EVG1 homolog n=1 Tax=Anoplophora glabripennis TaxID=217634 RepID=UPI0008757DFE|nr:UPF0193 protein EVG1 homolog [Anoplophora glabripennis]
MEWPSRNVAHGGILHAHKVSYSPETHKFLKLLMDESKMTMMQRNKLNYYLRNGEPLPSARKISSGSKLNVPLVTIRPGSSKRRSRDTIIKSGVYERDKYYPIHPKVDREKEKEKLQDKMAYNKEIKVRKAKVLKGKDKGDDEVEINRFDQLMQEIKDREDWLKEMEELGQGEKYRLIITQQIQSKVREMQNLKLPFKK